MHINVFPTGILRLSFLLILFLYTFHINANKHEENDDNEDFIDLGVRLIGGKEDSLIADLIAQERNVLNAGLVKLKKRMRRHIWLLLFYFID
jgi:hypothetical protein